MSLAAAGLIAHVWDEFAEGVHPKSTIRSTLSYLIWMCTESLSLEDLMGHESDPGEVDSGLAEPEYFDFTFNRDDVGTVNHRAYPETVTLVRNAESQIIRSLDDEGWRFFAVVHTQDALWSNTRYLFENEEGDIFDAVIETGVGVEFLHRVTIEATE